MVRISKSLVDLLYDLLVESMGTDYVEQVKKGHPSQKTWMMNHRIRGIGVAS